MLVPSSLKNRHGFTMIELLVAIVIMAIGVLATLSMISTSINANTISNKLTTKTALAQQVMEDLLSRKANEFDPNDPILNSTVTTAYDLNGAASGTDISINGGGVYHATYSSRVNTPEIGTTQLVVTVSTVPNDGNPFVQTCYKRATN